ncbi:MAG TPA: beta-L-arabinofuranosidase domain-containing protein, partial [Lacunisphaera sp.]|nr:beta-L-arabinofuranosidase domain-containing protein [Lacunisphaera sp.]
MSPLRLPVLSLRFAFVAALLAGAGPAVSAAAGGTGEVATFPLGRVRLLDGPFKHAQEVNRRYLLAHDIDRLLAPFRIEAGLPSPKPKYPNWESSGLDGHTAGHYLTALAQEWAASGDAEWQRRLDAMVAGLAACQQAGGDGYVGGIPRWRTLWNDIAAA